MLSERLSALRERIGQWWARRPRLSFRRAARNPDDTPRASGGGIRRFLRPSASPKGGRGGRRFRSRRGWLTGGVVVVLLIVGVLFLTMRGRQQKEAAGLAETLRSASVSRSALMVTVSATGELEPAHEAELPFLVSGEVAEVYVNTGDRVEQGALLASLDNRLLEMSLRDAEVAQALQEIALQELEAGASEGDIQVARATVGLAQARLNLVTAPPDEYDARMAEFGVQLARNQLYLDQTTRDMADIPGAQEWRLDAGFEQALAAELGVDIAELQMEQLLQGPSAGNVATARAQVAAAQGALNNLLEGPNQYDLAIAEKQVELAGLSVELARGTLEDAEIRAPFDGTVAEVNVDIGEQAQPGASVIRLIDESEYRLKLDVDEVDIGGVRVEQAVEITFDALPGVVMTGRVERIAPMATEVGGVVTYPVRVTLDPTPEPQPLRSGMTATAVITVDEMPNALLVPNWAVRIDRRTGEAFVSVRSPDGVIEEVSVSIGLRNEMFSQVLSGLKDGDEVVVSQEREGFSFFGGEE